MRIALIAHDSKKELMIQLTTAYQNILSQHDLVATGTTGKCISQATGLKVHCYQSGPLGGDQQIGAEVSQNQIDCVIFLRDPLTAMPHEPDVNALIRLCDVYNVPLATNIGSAEVLVRGLGAGLINWRANYADGEVNRDIRENLSHGSVNRPLKED
ncbi:methylglyoxal synthase [Aerococcus urinae]|uniref:Methylglyoxal synthase n=1 Tax=Aerococcus urinae TaxID=1376 RepID=A0A109REK1_9LACT|nr:methylglyoxal synthase [Aerococcus urinae]AMB96021.1 methylglyoxal synthase [Aerococcus urinae]MCY3033106.1 methylglyoxal synthase [Aerococcus urinae]MCY3038250.1 methylglyoxal synthase [Aerococcus urinae]MCY3045152.1 methylglyoxal synthase [Aerococcus urinae]MCY3046657.1 methylglyoxal synthase [Aerococcus urinae]